MHAKPERKTISWWKATFKTEHETIENNSRTKAAKILAAKYGFSHQNVYSRMRVVFGRLSEGHVYKMPRVKWSEIETQTLLDTIVVINNVLKFRESEAQSKVDKLKMELAAMGLSLSDFVKE
jgi:hypothetical protein